VRIFKNKVKLTKSSSFFDFFFSPSCIKRYIDIDNEIKGASGWNCYKS